MAPASTAHTRSHSLLLLQKLLNLRDGASPLTLILDSLEQPATPLVSEFITRAKLSKVKVILVSFATIKKARDVDVVVKAAGREFSAICKELLSHYPATDSATAAVDNRSAQRVLVVIDSLNSLGSAIAQTLASFLFNIITPAASVVGVYHTDVPVVLPATCSEYEPEPFTVLCHVATAILRLSSLQQEVARQQARNKALVEPEWGIDEEREGVLVGLVEVAGGRGGGGGGRRKSEADATMSSCKGSVVIGMELRRRSGRAVRETFVLVRSRERKGPGKLMLLSDHLAFVAAADLAQVGDGNGNKDDDDDAEPESTFNLGLTEKQRRDREGIVLPYFDAQTDVGGGEGGRILYEMGREDDFDEEEDEI